MSITNPIAETKRAVKSASVRECAANLPRGVAKNATPAKIYGPPLPPIPNAETIAAMKEVEAGEFESASTIEEMLAKLNA